MLFTTPEQRRVRLDFPCAGPFGPLGRPKDIRERLEENSSERQRLRRTAEYNGKRSEVHSKFLLSPFICHYRKMKQNAIHRAFARNHCWRAFLYIYALTYCIFWLHLSQTYKTYTKQRILWTTYIWKNYHCKDLPPHSHRCNNSCSTYTRCSIHRYSFAWVARHSSPSTARNIASPLDR